MKQFEHLNGRIMRQPENEACVFFCRIIITTSLRPHDVKDETRNSKWLNFLGESKIVEYFWCNIHIDIYIYIHVCVGVNIVNLAWIPGQVETLVDCSQLFGHVYYRDV